MRVEGMRVWEEKVREKGGECERRGEKCMLEKIIRIILNHNKDQKREAPSLHGRISEGVN